MILHFNIFIWLISKLTFINRTMLSYQTVIKQTCMKAGLSRISVNSKMLLRKLTLHMPYRYATDNSGDDDGDKVCDGLCVDHTV